MITIARSVEVFRRRLQQHPAREGCRGRLPLRGLLQRIEPVGLGERIGIEERKRIVPAGGPGSDVVCTGETDIGAEPDQLDVPERWPRQSQRVVAAAVVDHDNVVRAASLPVERLQAPAEQRTTVPIDDQDGDRHAAELPDLSTSG